MVRRACMTSDYCGTCPGDAEGPQRQRLWRDPHAPGSFHICLPGECRGFTEQSHYPLMHASAFNRATFLAIPDSCITRTTSSKFL
jgi:hypothetical protein